MLRFGPDNGALVVVAPALFEEANRMRAFTTAILRRLAERGIASVLPDLPGQGESVVPTYEARLAHWREAFAGAVTTVARQRPVDGIVSIRAGALVDTLVPATARWHLSPMSGEELLRDLRRVRRAAGNADGPDGRQMVEIAGNLLSPTLLGELTTATPKPSRVVRLDTDPRAADRKVPGAPLWRKPEPTTDNALSQLLAEDIADWIRSCAD